jgi:putative ABC transport system substrate-binding protein
MKRRYFIGALGGAALPWPLQARAERAGKMARIGIVLTDPTNPITAQNNGALLAGLRDLGYSEGKNLDVFQMDVLSQSPAAFPSDLDLIVASGPEVTLRAALALGRTVPIVIVAANYDPLALGYVTNLARPGGKITGVVTRQPELAGKAVELLIQAFPDRTRVAALWDSISADQFGAAERVAQPLHVALLGLRLENPPYDFDAAFRNLLQTAPQMLLVLSSPYFTGQRSRITELAVEHRLPTMFTFKAYVEAGGLLYYGLKLDKMTRRAASYVAKILDGAKPGDLPVEQPTEFELVINLKTAKALGITIPPSLLARADEVIE